MSRNTGFVSIFSTGKEVDAAPIVSKASQTSSEIQFVRGKLKYDALMVALTETDNLIRVKEANAEEVSGKKMDVVIHEDKIAEQKVDDIDRKVSVIDAALEDIYASHSLQEDGAADLSKRKVLSRVHIAELEMERSCLRNERCSLKDSWMDARGQWRQLTDQLMDLAAQIHDLLERREELMGTLAQVSEERKKQFSITVRKVNVDNPAVKHYVLVGQFIRKSSSSVLNEIHKNIDEMARTVTCSHSPSCFGYVAGSSGLGKTQLAFALKLRTLYITFGRRCCYG
jgi:hypothetical protein